jgi:Tat protein secretion system quality control protein TatD with DNase activity
VARAVAALRGRTVEAIAEATTANAVALFGLDGRAGGP